VALVQTRAGSSAPLRLWAPLVWALPQELEAEALVFGGQNGGFTSELPSSLGQAYGQVLVAVLIPERAD